VVTPGIPPGGVATRTDALLDGRVTLRQPVSGYRVAVDPVLLAAAVPADAGARVLDLGCGVGAAALCLLARVPGVRVVGLERQAELAALARTNAALNDGPQSFLPVVGDVARPPFRTDGAFDQVFANPPYQRAGRGHAPAEPLARAANLEDAAGLDTWIASACRLVRRKGTVTLIHRADRLDEILAALAGRAGGIVVVPVRPHADADARRVIVRARPGSAAPLRLTRPLVLHAADGADTPAARAILRGAAALEI